MGCGDFPKKDRLPRSPTVSETTAALPSASPQNMPGVSSFKCPPEDLDLRCCWKTWGNGRECSVCWWLHRGQVHGWCISYVWLHIWELKGLVYILSSLCDSEWLWGSRWSLSFFFCLGFFFFFLLIVTTETKWEDSKEHQGHIQRKQPQTFCTNENSEAPEIFRCSAVFLRPPSLQSLRQHVSERLWNPRRSTVPLTVPINKDGCICCPWLPQQYPMSRGVESHQNVFSGRSGVWKSEIKASADVVPSEGSRTESAPCFSPWSQGLPEIPGLPWFVDMSGWPRPRPLQSREHQSSFESEEKAHVTAEAIPALVTYGRPGCIQ